MKQKPRYKIRFPASDTRQLSQDESYFFLEEHATEEPQQIRFHDYGALYARPGLYEQLFYDRLKCDSPTKVAGLLKKVVDDASGKFSQLRIIDLGAGNGIMGECLLKYGVARLIGVDILQEAAHAVSRDRPSVYDAYYLADFTQLQPDIREELSCWRFNCMVTVAALGFGDIPPTAFLEAFNLIEEQGWVAFNIKETFFDNRDNSGFSVFIKNLILTEYLDLHHLERYQHRLSIDGEPLYYYALIGRKNQNIPSDFLEKMMS
jgi:predicted TPR repeat methyltransferase